MHTVNWPSMLAAPLPIDSISWRQDGRPTQRDGKFVARFVAYTDAQAVRERLDTVVPGEWSLTLELLPSQALADDNGEILCAFKARLTVVDVIREDIGQGKDYKSASTDAFKRAAVRFGIGHELYSMGQVWVAVDGDGKYAKPLEDPAAVYARKASGVKSAKAGDSDTRPAIRPEATDETTARQQSAPAPASPLDQEEPSCPKCGGQMWNNKLSKRNAKAPDYKCRSRACDGVIWPAKSTTHPAADDSWQPDESQSQVPF